MSRDNNSCVSEVTTAISRLRMLTTDPNDSPNQNEEPNAKTSSPETECVAITSSNSFRLGVRTFFFFFFFYYEIIFLSNFY